MRKFSPRLDVLLVEASVKLGYQEGVLGSKLSSDEYMVRRSSLYTNAHERMKQKYSHVLTENHFERLLMEAMTTKRP
jgi:hypothetical protein